MCCNKLWICWATAGSLQSSVRRSDASTTIDREVDTSDELALVARQKDSGITNIRWISQSLQRDTLGKLLAIFLGVLDADKAREQLRRRQQWANRRDADLMRSKFRSQAFRRLSTVSRSLFHDST